MTEFEDKVLSLMANSPSHMREEMLSLVKITAMIIGAVSTSHSDLLNGVAAASKALREIASDTFVKREKIRGRR